MVNGYDRNWVRACAAIEGFRVRYGKWPSRLRLFPVALEDLRDNVFSEESFGILCQRLDLVPAEHAAMVAEDEDGNSYSYGTEGMPNDELQARASEWLGIVPDGPGAAGRERRDRDKQRQVGPCATPPLFWATKTRTGSGMMKVADLIAGLRELDPDLEVVCYTEDEAALRPGHGFALFDIQEVTTTEGEMTRGEDQVPSLRLGAGPASQKLAVLDVTSDF
jgi:hypothetical protein